MSNPTPNQILTDILAEEAKQSFIRSMRLTREKLEDLKEVYGTETSEYNYILGYFDALQAIERHINLINEIGE